MALPREYDDLPGTIVFDADRARQGYHLNMFCMSLMKPENRAAFKENERAYLDQWPMTEAQKQSLLKRDWNGMLQLGGNIYFTAKLAATDGLSFQQIAATAMKEAAARATPTPNSAAIVKMDDHSSRPPLAAGST